MNEATGQYSVVSGGGGTGGSDGNLAHGDYSVIAGGRQNLVGSEIVGNNDYATVSGGQLNNAAGMHSTVGGGKQNTASSPYSTVSGGWNNTASGGETQEGATVGGGENNTASSYMATVGGGTDNHAVGPNSTVAGGQDNTAGGVSATVGGGEGNFAEADFTTIPGGRGNVALGDYSFAAGVGAKANHRGSVVIAAHVWGGGGRALDEDSVQTGGNSQMVLRADSLFYLTNTGEKAPPNPGGGGPGNRFLDTSTGAYLSKSGTWQNSSSMKLKENFADVEGKDILSKLETLNITRWNYKIDGKEVSHIGPVSQDFYAAFGLGTDDGTISTIDPSGVALAAIQELIRESERRNARIVELEAELDEMKALMHELMSERR